METIDTIRHIYEDFDSLKQSTKSSSKVNNALFSVYGEEMF